MLELRATIHGDVQGVGFRHTTRTLAHQLNLKGYVRNKADGSVEILAQGEKPVLKHLLEKLKSAFDGDYIDHIDADFAEIEKSYEDFDITF